MNNMYDSTCSIYRNDTTKDQEYGRPVKTLILIGTFPCILTRKKQGFKQGNPNATVDSGFRLYGAADMDVKAGDIVEVNGEKYIASAPYKPGGDHTEIDLEIKRDA